ncbi:MAG: carboxypeptidase regulatory-like domain-containing protein, partial [Actinomycetota bacterium]
MDRKVILIVSVLATVLILVAGVVLFGTFGTSVNGRIVDKRTGKPIANASVRIGEKSAHTNKNGYYVLKVSQGKREAVVKATGYETADIKINVPIFFSKNLGILKIQNGTIKGKVTEDIPSPNPITGLKVTLAGKEIKPDPQGLFTAYDILVGYVTIVIEAPSYERFEKKITIRGGNNDFAVAMSLTPDSTSMHYLEAIKQRNFSFIYD